jgi:tetratricopeptide (TPR) repeat protein
MEAKALAKKIQDALSVPVLPAGQRTPPVAPVLGVTLFSLAAAAALLLPAACSKPREITSLQRKEAANLASEAQFAMTLRDFPRAEALLAKASALSPDDGELWLNLGSMRMRLKNRDGAKSAYRSALSVYEESYRKTPTETEALLQQVYVLALLGDVKEARARLEKSRKKHPDDRGIRVFIEEKQLETMMADPSFKEMAL